MNRDVWITDSTDYCNYSMSDHSRDLYASILQGTKYRPVSRQAIPTQKIFNIRLILKIKLLDSYTIIYNALAYSTTLLLLLHYPKTKTCTYIV